MPSTIGAVISNGLASYVELKTVLGVEDLYALLEIMAVDAHNKLKVQAANKGK